MNTPPLPPPMLKTLATLPISGAHSRLGAHYPQLSSGISLHTHFLHLHGGGGIHIDTSDRGCCCEAPKQLVVYLHCTIPLPPPSSGHLPILYFK